MGRKFEIEEQDYLKKLGKVLRKCRKDKSQIDVSKQIHISATDISRYENGTKNIDILTLRKFCEYYRISMSSLIYNIQTHNKTKINDELDVLKKNLDNFYKDTNQTIRNIRNSDEK